MKTGRNESCPCGSGLKYKHCCEGIKPWYKEPRWIGILIAATLAVAVALAWGQLTGQDTVEQGRVWSPEHGHYH